MTPRSRAAWLVLLLGTLSCALILVSLERSSLSWTAWRPASCMPAKCFCERVRDTAVRQPVNAWSSLAFVAAGLWIAGLAPSGRENPVGRRPVFRRVFAAALVVIGIGSVFYHATLSFAGQFFDVFGMYLLATFVVLYAWSRLQARNSAVVLPYLGLNAVLAVLLYTVPSVRRFAFAVLIAAGMALEARVGKLQCRVMERRFLIYSLAVLSAGFAAWVVDITRLVCRPSGLIQGHALWHVAGAVAALLLFRYYSSETAVRGRPR